MPSLNGAKATWRQEVPSPNDLDSTLLDQDGDGQVARESSAPPVDAHDPATTQQHSLPAASPEPEHAEPETTKQTARRARPVAPPVRISPHQTRARSRLGTVNLPDPTPASTSRRTASGAKITAATPSPRRTRVRSRSSSVDSLEVAARAIVAMGIPRTTTLEAVLESEPHAAHDEFVAHSEDEGDMQEVEVNLHIEAGFSGDDPHAGSQARGLSADDLQTYMRLRKAEGVGAVDLDEDEDEEDEDSSDAELLARVKKLGTRPPPPTPPKARAHRNLNRDEESDELSAEELVPPRAQAEKSRRTQVATGAPYVPPPGTRAVVMMEKGKGKAALLRE
ncbi:hypothetical protein EDB84DRAFT_527240 [Lactarius hengduanensis]|nr:hypothetical protein EDB84DRAFT_527240 [Lactarius hengduanensis]